MITMQLLCNPASWRAAGLLTDLLQGVGGCGLE